MTRTSYMVSWTEEGGPREQTLFVAESMTAAAHAARRMLSSRSVVDAVHDLQRGVARPV